MSKFNFTIPKPKFDNSAWKVKDPEWLAQREKDFESVALNYKLYNPNGTTTQGGLDKELRTLRNYFVLGKLGSGQQAMPKSLTYHPEPSIDLIKDWVERGLWKESIGMRNSDIRFLMIPSDTTDYGSAGGKEKQILDICLLGATEYTEEKMDIGGKFEYKLPFLQAQNSLHNFLHYYMLNWFKALFEPKTNPHSILPYLLSIFFTLLHDKGQELEQAQFIPPIPDPYHKGQTSDKKKYCLADGLYALFVAIHHYYEPHVLPGEKSIVKPWVDEFKRCYEQYSLPEAYESLWQKAKEETEESWLEIIAIPVQELVTPDFYFAGAYQTYLVHGEEVSPALFEKVINEFRLMHATETIFNPNDVRLVSIKRQIHPEIAKRLGYKKGEDVPAYAFRITATSGFLATTKASLAIDLVMPVSKAPVTEDTPSLLIIERPDQQYRIDKNRRYILQRRLVIKTIRNRTGLNVVRYKPFTVQHSIPPKSPADFAAYYKENYEPFYNAEYYPLVTSFWALTDTEEYAFKPWDKGGYPQFTEI